MHFTYTCANTRAILNTHNTRLIRLPFFTRKSNYSNKNACDPCKFFYHPGTPRKMLWPTAMGWHGLRSNGVFPISQPSRSYWSHLQLRSLIIWSSMCVACMGMFLCIAFQFKLAGWRQHFKSTALSNISSHGTKLRNSNQSRHTKFPASKETFVHANPKTDLSELDKV